MLKRGVGMNRTISERRADGECKDTKCIDCDYCFIHSSLGVACGKEYPATYASIEDDDGVYPYDYGEE